MSANVRPKWLRPDRRLLAQALSAALVGGLALTALFAAIALASQGLL